MPEPLTELDAVEQATTALHEAQAARLRAMADAYDIGASLRDIAAAADVSPQTVLNMLNGSRT